MYTWLWTAFVVFIIKAFFSLILSTLILSTLHSIKHSCNTNPNGAKHIYIDTYIDNSNPTYHHRQRYSSKEFK